MRTTKSRLLRTLDAAEKREEREIRRAERRRLRAEHRAARRQRATRSAPRAPAGGTVTLSRRTGPEAAYPELGK
jgi:hypothetical protein